MTIWMDKAMADAINAAADSVDGGRSFDAVVVGAGASGGMAAECLTKAGLNVLLLDAGLQAPRRADLRRWCGSLADALARSRGPRAVTSRLSRVARRASRMAGAIRQPVQSRCESWISSPDAFIDDRDCPYSTSRGNTFVWVRVRGLQGRMAVPWHGRQYYRFGPDDLRFGGGAGAPWPFPATELDPWYRQVERRIGLSGMNDGLPWLPDSDISHPVRPTQTELRLMEAVRARWPSARPIMGRYGSPPDSLAQAARTGRLTLRQGAVVRAIDVERGKATGVSWVDAITRREHATRAPLIFLCASALESTRILLLSQDRATGRPLGRASEALGRYLMDHIRLFFRGSFEAGSDDGPATEPGRCVYLPRFDARGVDSPGPGRGFGVQVSVNAVGGGRAMVSAGAFGEMRPRAENRVVVDPSRIDRWGIPILRIDCAHREEELRLGADQRLALLELAETLGVRQLELEAAPRPPGLALHECGTARMGDDPATSVLDPHNQCWDASGLFVVDGAAFVSQGSQNPTLTIMALTARACAHAVGRASYPLHSP